MKQYGQEEELKFHILVLRENTDDSKCVNLTVEDYPSEYNLAVQFVR